MATNPTKEDLIKKGLVEVSPGKFEPAVKFVKNKDAQTESGVDDVTMIVQIPKIEPLSEEIKKKQQYDYNLRAPIKPALGKDMNQIIEENKSKLSFPQLVDEMVKHYENVSLVKERIIIKINPVSKPRMTKRDVWLSPRRRVVQKYWDFKEQLNEALKQNNISLTDTISVKFCIQMPKSWSKKKREAFNNYPHLRTPDLDNLLKALKDAVYKNDCGVHTYKNISKVWSITGTIEIYEYQTRTNEH